MPDPAPARSLPAAAPRRFHAAIRFARIGPRKVRYVTELLKGQSVNRAKERLYFIEKRGARFVNKILNSVLANVAHLQQDKDVEIDVNRLRIQRIWVEPGPTMKRFTPAPQGRAVPIRKRFCHIHVVVAEGAAEAAPGQRERRVRASRAAAAPTPPAPGGAKE